MIRKYLTKFKSWMNYSPPGALTSKGWRLFNAEFEKVAPIRFWIKNDLRRKLILPIKWKYEAVTDWVRYRTYDQYHVVKTDLEPSYYEVSTILLHANFTLLVDFVETESAWMKHITDEKKQRPWQEKYVPFYRIMVPFRRPDLGIEHLQWESTLDDPNLPRNQQSVNQAISAREILALYIWWTKTRKDRKLPESVRYDDQGLGILSSLDDDFDTTAADFVSHMSHMDQCRELEEKWEAEDEEMLIRLIKIRKSLWT